MRGLGPAGRGRLARYRGSRLGVTLGVALAVAVIALLAGGCTVETGSSQEVIIDEPLGAAALTDVELSMGAGSLKIGPGATGLASGTIVYNVDSWAPEVVRTDDGLTIKQGTGKGVSGLPTDIVNRWDLLLGKAPMRLSISAGAYDGSYDLSGLTLEELTIKDGAARTELVFDSPNPGQMSRLLYETGASSVSLSGLANANFKDMTFNSGAGSYSLDFSGQLRTDASVRIASGAGTVRITVPQSTAAQVTIAGSLNEVETQGVWVTSGDVYSTTAVGKMPQGRMLDITLEMNVGSITLVAK